MEERVSSMEINPYFLDFTQRLVPISDFSRGKTAQLFDDVKKNNTEYVVLKNNQPTAMVISLDMYRELVEKACKMERLLDRIEEDRLLAVAQERMKNADFSQSVDHDMVCRELGFDPAEIEADCESVEIE